MAVASVVYNMAGDAANRQDYVKGLIVRKVFSRGPESMGDTLSSGLLHGPAMRLRSFYKWAAYGSHYPLVGLPASNLNQLSSLQSIVNPGGLASGETFTPQAYEVGPPQAVWWAKRWILDNRSGDFLLDWKCAFNGDFTSVIITFPAGSPLPLNVTVPVTSPDYDAGVLYLSYEYTKSYSSSVNRQFIYKFFTGKPGADAYYGDAYDLGFFFPSIPVRLNNAFLTPGTRLHGQAEEAYKRMTGGAKYGDLIDKISENPDISDIDYIYVTLGVALNVRENAPREYIYRFFKMIMGIQKGGGVGAYDAWVARGYSSTPETTLFVGGISNLVYGQYASTLRWRLVVERTELAGLGKVGAKLGELWFEKRSTTGGYTTLRLYWQKTLSSHSYIETVGLYHQNNVYGYGGENVQTLQFAAIDDLEESGFIIPIHYNTWREMNLVQASRMASSQSFIVFNCVEIYKEKWYESGFFKILLVVAIAVVGVLVFGPAGVGLLGANLALGTALGFTGMTAAIIGAVANALAAMILISLLQPAIDRAFGSMAPVASAIIMFAIGAAAGSLTSTGTVTINWGDMLRVDNLIAMTSAVGTGISNQINADTLKLQQSGLDYQENAQAEINKIQQAFFEEFGYGAGVIDPMMLVDAPKGPIAESSSTFLTRTLMTGSEIAEMSRQLLYEFPAYSLKLPDAFT